ncbi:MAG: glycosyltransferase [Chloroflexi bacterium]|nr:glycosyltransferase [Chloroflexota bacterium]MBI3732691.1 glycosyltransferase [Chloroflexota bacterium]
MKSVLVYYEKLLGPGGAERQAVEDCRFLARSDVRVRLVTHELVREAIFDLPAEQVEVLPDGPVLKRVSHLRRLLQAERPDVLSVHSGHLEAFLASAGLGVPYIFHHNSPILLHHGDIADYLYAWLYRRALMAVREWSRGGRDHVDFSKTPFGWQERPRIEAKALLNWAAVRSARLIVVLSRLTAREVKTVYGAEAFVSRGCLNTEMLGYQPARDLKQALGLAGRRVILSISRLSFEKRIDVLLRAFQPLAQAQPDLVLVIGGKGPQAEELRRLAGELGIAEQVRFAGFVPQSDLWDTYAMCDLFVSPAWADFDIAPYEALALQKKVVWSTEMETEPWVMASGLVFEADPTPDAFGQAIRRALDAEPASHLDVTPYTWDAKFTRIYQRIFPDFPRGPSGAAR